MKKIKTTLCVEKTNYAIIKTMASIKKITVNDMIIKLLMIGSKKFKKNHLQCKAVKYQEKNPLKNWKIQHVSFSGDEYEFFTDQRKLFKMSVSLLLKIALEEYESNNIDNYYLIHHSIEHKIEQNRTIWSICWEKTEILENIQLKFLTI